jgi:hypothetical protein
MSSVSPSTQQNVNLRKRRQGSYAVLILRPGPDWKPSSPSSMPSSVVGARFLARRLNVTCASAICQGFNLNALGNYAGEWAIVASSQFGVLPATD